MVYKVGIIGPESSGKSTLARYLAKRYKGVYVPEYGRSYIEQKGTKEVSYDEVCEIARHQIEELDTFSRQDSDTVYFFDTELVVTKVWFEYAFGHVPEWLEEAGCVSADEARYPVGRRPYPFQRFGCYPSGTLRAL